MLGNDNPTTWIIYNHLIREFGLFPILLEQPVPKRILFRNRVHKLGYANALSQVMFIRTIRAWLNWRCADRITRICLAASMERAKPATSAITSIESVNSDECRKLLKTLDPKVIVVNGTRIIGKATLESCKANFINTHHGITPNYRGAHGAYWALFQNDAAHCGVTVHEIDEGIDTGGIIAQELITVDREDSFVTYPYLLTEKALPLLTDAIRKVKNNTIRTRPATGLSAVWYHPGFFQYITGWLRGIR